MYQVLLEEAHDSYDEEIVTELQSNTIEDISNNVSTLTDWINAWQP